MDSQAKAKELENEEVAQILQQLQQEELTESESITDPSILEAAAELQEVGEDTGSLEDPNPPKDNDGPVFLFFFYVSELILERLE